MVEYHLAKVGVAGSSPVSRSIRKTILYGWSFFVDVNSIDISLYFFNKVLFILLISVMIYMYVLIGRGLFTWQKEIEHGVAH